GNGSGGWGNNELQYYTNANTIMQDGYLTIKAKKETMGGYNYTSSRIITKGKQEFKYGRIDIRAILPKGQGIWPALWMLGSNISTVGWPKCGEIDIMEMIGGGANRDNRVYGTVHWDNAGAYASYGGNKTLSEGIFADKFHVFSIVWNEEEIIWYLDDVQYHVISLEPAELSEFKSDYFVIFNVAVGGNWPGAPDATLIFPQRMIVDYIRVFQPE
ncbi:MAG TPA: glycoside hydrolase family 16 protein, partial [Chryseolinea sp.]|nr:glycoside hydrolase family 16 protein [Chryseolinea sp.]